MLPESNDYGENAQRQQHLDTARVAGEELVSNVDRRNKDFSVHVVDFCIIFQYIDRNICVVIDGERVLLS